MAENCCQRCESPVEPEDLRCVICGLSTPATAQVSARAYADVLRCDGCGAAVVYRVESQAPACAFCGDVMHLEKPSDPMEEADGYLPFEVDIEEAKRALSGWLGGLGFFSPSDLRSHSRIEELTPLYWVGWLCDAESRVCWTADSNAGALRSDWAPHAGEQSVSYRNLLVPATRGLTPTEVSQLTPHYKLGRILSAPSQNTAGSQNAVERFDVQRSAARERVLDGIKSRSAADAKSWVPGTRMRNLRVALRLRRLNTRRLAFPAYVMAYRYRDKLYRALVHGQNAACTFGDAPLSWRKIVATAAACGVAVFTMLWLLSR